MDLLCDRERSQHLLRITARYPEGLLATLLD